MRSQFVDFLRSTSILLMFFYHFVFDLGYFGYHSINLNRETEWIIFRYIIISGFLLSAGISLVLAHKDQMKIRSFIKRMVWLLVALLLVSVGSYIIFPDSWIYFGVLHFIFIASICAVWLRNFPILCLIIGVTILITYNMGVLSNHFAYDFFKNLFNLPNHTEDLVPFFPWFAVVLLGMFLGHFRFYERPVFKKLTMPWMRWLSQHSLLVYLVHQPVFFAGLYLST